VDNVGVLNAGGEKRLITREGSHRERIRDVVQTQKGDDGMERTSVKIKGPRLLAGRSSVVHKRYRKRLGRTDLGRGSKKSNTEKLAAELSTRKPQKTRRGDFRPPTEEGMTNRRKIKEGGKGIVAGTCTFSWQVLLKKHEPPGQRVKEKTSAKT